MEPLGYADAEVVGHIATWANACEHSSTVEVEGGCTSEEGPGMPPTRRTKGGIGWQSAGHVAMPTRRAGQRLGRRMSDGIA